jgi:hypothetical protein
VVAEGFGSWLEFVAWAEANKEPEIWWTVDMPKPDWAHPRTQFILESDSSKR